MQVTGKNILVIVDEDPEEEETEGGIVITAPVHDMFQEATVTHVGDDVELEIKPGSRVLIQRYSGQEYDGRHFVQQNHVFAILK